MFALGQKRILTRFLRMSALPQKADIDPAAWRYSPQSAAPMEWFHTRRPLIFLVSSKPLPFACLVEVGRCAKMWGVSWMQSFFCLCWVLASLPDTASGTGSLASAAVAIRI
jgi:hypothetical protein